MRPISMAIVWNRRDGNLFSTKIVKMHSIFRSNGHLTGFKLVVETKMNIFLIRFKIMDSRIKEYHLPLVLNGAS